MMKIKENNLIIAWSSKEMIKILDFFWGIFKDFSFYQFKKNISKTQIYLLIRYLKDVGIKFEELFKRK